VKKLLRKMLIWAYWHFKCHRDEPWADQLLLYAIPRAVRPNYGLIALEIRDIINNQRVDVLGWKPLDGLPVLEATATVFGKDIING